MGYEVSAVVNIEVTFAFHSPAVKNKTTGSSEMPAGIYSIMWHCTREESEHDIKMNTKEVE